VRVGPDARLAVAGLIPSLTATKVRCRVTIVPALAVLAAGVSPTDILIFSQVILSFGIPFALVPLVLVSADQRIMGTFAIGGRTAAGMWLITAAIAGLNVILLCQQLLG
jgi:manganese transport protein